MRQRKMLACVLCGVLAASLGLAWVRGAGGGKRGGRHRKDRRGKNEPRLAQRAAESAAQRAARRRKVPFSEQAVNRAIDRAISFLLSKEQSNGSWGPYKEGRYPVGPTALACYALLEAGVNAQNPKMVKALAWLSRQQTDKTYELACRANAYLAADHQRPGRYLNLLAADARRLIAGGTLLGAYNYNVTDDPRKRWDNSNSQFGLLGVWAWDQDRGEVPQQYWQVVLRHWVACQNADGGWGYREGGRGNTGASRGPMTAGGIASIFVCFDHVFAAQFVQCRRGMTYKPIVNGLDWMDKHFVSSLRTSMGPYYYLYGVERAALASGYKYFGQADWYKVGAARLLASQKRNGAWKDPVNTSFALLFLIRGRNAVVFNKLDYEGDWNDRPRDLASVTRWLSRTFEKTVNWQIINLRTPVREWHDAPILYIAGSQAPKFTDADLDKLRTFVEQGGTILSVDECGGRGFAKGIREVYAKLFPRYKLTPCPPTHEIYTTRTHFALPGQPKLFVLSNGVRPLAIHTDEDVSLAWQLHRMATQRYCYEAAANIIEYVTDTIANLRPRGTTNWPEPVPGPFQRTIAVVRLRHKGNWNPEPLALQRLARRIAAANHVKLDVRQGVDIGDLAGSQAKVAFLTGTKTLSLTGAQQAALKAYVAAGGTLVIDAAGGSKAFADSAEKTLETMYGRRALHPVSMTASFLTLAGHEIRSVRYRRRARMRLGDTTAVDLRAVQVGPGRLGVLFSREDLTAGLVGYLSHTVDGYTPQSAYRIVRNLVLWAGGGA